jgi:hypothetical protein
MHTPGLNKGAMMQFENPLTFVRAMKGAAISILVACMFARKALTNLELQMWTGYKDEAITEASKLLCTLGWLVAHSRVGPWSLAEGRQLPLMAIADELAVVAGESSGFSGTGSSSSNSKLNGPSNLEEQEEQESSGFSGTLPGVLDALDAAGIREPKRSRLAKLPHVTVEMINAHVERCKAEGLELGTAIYRIQYNWAYEVPRVKLPKKKADALSTKIDQLRARAWSDEE